jgi:hypothetical protein
VDSPFSLLLALTLVESVLIISRLSNQNRRDPIRRNLLAILIRALSPCLILFAVLISDFQGPQGAFADLDPRSAPLLVAAGLLGVLGWVFSLRLIDKDASDGIPRAAAEFLPGSISLLLIIKAGALQSGDLSNQTLTLLGIVALILVLITNIIRSPRLGWILAVLGLAAGGALVSSLPAALIWSMILLISGYIFSSRPSGTRFDQLVLGIGMLASLPVPFLPAWIGSGLFGRGIGGYIIALSLALAGAGLLRSRFHQVASTSGWSTFSALGGIPPVVALYLTAILSGLFPGSLQPLAYGLAPWLPILILPLGLFRRWSMPLPRIPDAAELLDRMTPGSRSSLAWLRELGERIFISLTEIFEGDGGLIWALLTAFLILTLISLGSG